MDDAPSLDEEPHARRGPRHVERTGFLALLQLEEHLEEADGDRHSPEHRLVLALLMATRSDIPRNSEEGRAFLQWRVAGFGRILGALVLGFYVLANAAGMLHPLAKWTDWVSPANTL